MSIGDSQHGTSVARALPTWAVRAVLPIAATVGLLLIGVLALRVRWSRNEISRLMFESRMPHQGQWVPAVETISDEGVRVVLGSGGVRQVLLLLQSTCEFCRQSISAWNTLADSVRASSGGTVQVIGVQLDSVMGAKEYATGHKLRFPLVRFSTLRDARIYAARATPYIVIVDTSGRVEYARPHTLVAQNALDSVIAISMRRVPPTGTRR